MKSSDIKPGAVYMENFPSCNVWLVLEILRHEDDCIIVRELNLQGRREGKVGSATIPFYLLDGFTLIAEGP